MRNTLKINDLLYVIQVGLMPVYGHNTKIEVNRYD